MATVTMTLYEALTKKKIYEDRLKKFNLKDKAIVGHYTEMKKSVNGVSLEDAENLMKSNFDSFMHIQSNILALQIAINQANLEHKIVIKGYKNDQEITLVEAITANQRLDNRIAYLNAISNKIQNELNIIESENDRILDQDYVYSQVSKQGTNDKKSENSADVLAQNIENYRKMNTVKLFDPNNLVSTGWVQKQIDEIDAFKSNLHNALMTANTTIMITVDLED